MFFGVPDHAIQQQFEKTMIIAATLFDEYFVFSDTVGLEP